MHMIRDIIRTLTYYGPNPKYDRSKNPLFDRFIGLKICHNNIDTMAGIILRMYPLYIQAALDREDNPLVWPRKKVTKHGNWDTGFSITWDSL